MRILYENFDKNGGESIFARHNIKDCCFKEITHKKDYKNTTFKSHCHIEYEVHMVTCGRQCYEIDNKVYEINEGEFIIIPPNVSHCIVHASENLSKYSLTFNADMSFGTSVYAGTIDEYVADGLCFIEEESGRGLMMSETLTENRIFELLIGVFRKSGYREGYQKKQVETNDVLVELAKKFINKNIGNNLSAADIAAYCHISTRQMDRRFVGAEGVSVAKYITDEKMRAVGKCVRETDLTMRQISESFAFNNQFYFNAAFKKYFGMPPSVYRRMYR